MDNMFNGCSALTTIYASDKFVTDYVHYGGNVFKGCTNLKGYDLSKTNYTYANCGTEGYFTPKEVYFLKKLSLIVSKECEFLHWGDMDFGGISIFMFIKDRIFEKLMPYRMGVADFEEALKKDAGIPLKASTREKLQKRTQDCLLN